MKSSSTATVQLHIANDEIKVFTRRGNRRAREMDRQRVAGNFQQLTLLHLQRRFALRAKKEELSMQRYLIAGAVAALAATSAFSQIAGTDLASDFYVVQDAATKKCSIVGAKPIETATIRIVDNGAFKTRAEAETGMKMMKVCAENR